MGRGLQIRGGGGAEQEEQERRAFAGRRRRDRPAEPPWQPVGAAEHLADDDAVVQGQDDAGQPVGRDGQPDAGAGGRGLDQLGQAAVQARRVLAERGGRLGVTGGEQPVLGVHEHPGAVGPEGGQAPLDGGADRVGLVLDAGQLLLGAGEVAGGLPGEEGGEQLVLGAEAGVEGAAGEAAPGADVLDAGGGEPDLGEGLQRRVEQPFHRLRPAPAGALDDGHDAGLYRIRPCIGRAARAFRTDAARRQPAQRATTSPNAAAACSSSASSTYSSRACMTAGVPGPTPRSARPAPPRPARTHR